MSKIILFLDGSVQESFLLKKLPKFQEHRQVCLWFRQLRAMKGEIDAADQRFRALARLPVSSPRHPAKSTTPTTIGSLGASEATIAASTTTASDV